MIGRRELALAAVAAAVFGVGQWPAVASAACGKPEKEKILKLYTEGKAFFDDLDMEAAKGSFKKALDAAKKADCSHKQVAKVWLRLGVIYKVADLDDGLALDAFKKALAIDPAVELERDVSTPEVESLLKKARGSAGVSSSGTGDSGDSGDSGDDGSSSSKPPPAVVDVAVVEKNLRCFAMRDGSPSTCVEEEEELKVQCESSTDLLGATMSYRVDGGPWVPNEMVGAGGFFGTTVSGASMKGKRVEFYVDATDAKSKRVAWAGTSAGPYGVRIGCGKKGSAGDDKPAKRTDDEDKPKKSVSDDPSMDEEDPLGGDGDDDGEDEPKPKKKKKDKDDKPSGGGGGKRLFSVLLGVGTGGGLATKPNWTQINYAMVGQGFMYSPVHLLVEPIFHIPLKMKIGIGVGGFFRLQLSPIPAWLAGLRAHLFVPMSKLLTLNLHLGFGLGPRCGTPAAMEASFGCRGGVGYLLNTPMFEMNPLDYVLIGPYHLNVGVSFWFEFSRIVALFVRLDLGAGFGSTGFMNAAGDPTPGFFQPHFDLTLGGRFGN